jgi:CubicO group peptidase (beta-lactamase class C family)
MQENLFGATYRKRKKYMKRTTIILIVIAVCSISTTGQSQDLNLHPERGYTQEQAATLSSRFVRATWSLNDDPDLSRFAYLNTSQFFRHALIHRAGPISNLPSAPHAKIGKTKVKTHAGEMTLDQWTDGHLDGCIVVLNGKIIYEKYPRMRPQDKHIWWSVSKSVAGTIVGLLEEQGKVDVRKPIETYIPELANSEWKGTPVIDILDMTSGMTVLEADDPEAYTNPASPYALFEGSLGLQAVIPKTMKSTYQYIATLKRQKPSGQRNEYTSVNTFVCAWLAEKVTGKPYPELVSEIFWQKMGAESDALIAVSEVGASGAHGYVNSTLRDLARYGMLYTPMWSVVAKQQVVPDALIRRIQEDGRPEVYQNGKGQALWDSYMGEECAHATRQFDFVTTDGDFGKAGYHGQTLYISPSKNLVVASFATVEKYDTFKFARAIRKSLK